MSYFLLNPLIKFNNGEILNTKSKNLKTAGYELYKKFSTFTTNKLNNFLISIYDKNKDRITNFLVNEKKTNKNNEVDFK